MESGLYDVGSFISALASDRRISAMRRVIRGYLRRGAHPFFVEQIVRLAFVKSRISTEREAGAKMVADVIKEHDRPSVPVPEAWDAGLARSLSRLYPKDGGSVAVRDMGIVFGVIVETLADVAEWKRKDLRSAVPAWKDYSSEFYERTASIPGASFKILQTLEHCSGCIEEFLGLIDPADLTPFLSGQSDHPVRMDDRLLADRRRQIRFIEERVGQLSFDVCIRELLDIWEDSSPFWFWNFFEEVLVAFEKQGQPDAASITLVALLEISSGDSERLSYVAERVLSGYPNGEATSADDLRDSVAGGIAYQKFIQRLRCEIGDPKVRCAIIRWVKRVSPYIRENILMGITFCPDERGSVAIDPRSETLVEDLFGSEVWGAVCAYQDPSFWGIHKNIYQGVPYRGDPKRSGPEAQVIKQSLARAAIDRHECDIAERLEEIVRDSGASEGEAVRIFEQGLDFLSGDVVVVVSHLTEEWRQLKRKHHEFFGTVLPRIDFAKNKKFGDRGAACKFRIFLPDLPARPLCGSLDPEGDLMLDNAPILDSRSKLVVRAVVVQTLCAVLIPSLVESIPANGNSGGEIVITGDPLARRPIIHTLGEIGAEDERTDESFSRSTRLNPLVAMYVFRWLLGQFPEYECRLHAEAEERVGSGVDVYYKLASNAKERLVKKRLRLSQVFIRAVRAHTRPLSVYLDETNTVRVKQRSERSKRNYERYREDGGRELTFASVQKTYVLQSGLRVPIQVERTFNQGCFVSLDDALRIIFDDSLKAEILQRFVR